MNDTYQDDLKAYLDGELPPLRRLAVRLHLTHCASCREEINQMTQVAEDLRSAEPEDALDPALRAKLLQIAPPAPNSVGAGEDKSIPASASAPTPPGLVAGGRKRPPLGWAIAGTALVAWFICYPTLRHAREAAAPVNAMLEVKPAYAPMAERPIAAFKASPPPPKVKPPPPLQVSAGAVPINGAQTYGYIPAPARTAFKPLVSYGSPQSGAAPDETAGESLRQVHKEASIGVQVPNPETTSDTVENMVKETGGYVASNNLSTGDDGLKSAELIVKVPVAQFEAFLAQVAKLGSVQSKNVSGEDITEKTSDADQTEGVLEDDVQKQEARLKALGSRAKWHDEQATRDLRIQLAEARARLVLLKRMATLGTLTIDLSQTPKPSAPAPVTGGFLSGLKASTHDALQSLVSSASALVALMIWLLAYAPLWVPALLVGRYALREYRRKVAV